MEHLVFVPVPVDRLRRALADPACVARAVPGLQQDAGAPPVTGRLKLRVGGHSVTYRGSLTVTPGADGTYAVAGEGAEARGEGRVRIALTLALADAEGGGTRVTFTGGGTGDGRIGDMPADAVGSALSRLASRFVENLGAGAAEDAPAGHPEFPQPAEAPEASDPAEAPHAPDPADAPRPLDSSGPADAPDDHPLPLSGTEIPPPSLDPDAPDTPDDDHLPALDDVLAGGVPDGMPEPPAEAAHARRTMIGRSAEEVDHAPPRGRYAPVPAPHSGAGTQALRWAAPAAAVALASAIVVGRALRKRR